MSRARCLHCGRQPPGRSGSIQAVVSTARHRADPRIWTFFSAGSTRTGQYDAGTICKDIFAAGSRSRGFCFRDGGSLKLRTNVRNTVLEVIGDTPAVRLRSLVTREMAAVIVKLEYYNPTGSYKDRMALAMIEGAEARGSLYPGMGVVWYTGGR